MIDPEKLNEGLLKLTMHMPMRAISINDERYLERYYVCSNEAGEQTWLHRFVGADGDRHFHSHPWRASSRILCGGYREECIFAGEFKRVFTHLYNAGDTNIITPGTLHKIVKIEPFTWSMMQVKPDWETWFFIDDKGATIQMGKTHGENWHAHYAPRENE